MGKLSSQGCTFTLEDTGSVARTVGGMISFSGLDGQATDKDRTTLDSTAREFAQGLRDGGNFSIELFRDPTDPGQSAALALKTARTNSVAVLTLASGDVVTFNCYVKSLTLGAQKNEDHQGTLNLKVISKPVWS
jgi:hypothetical protein